jgi:hypothetical protein
MPVDEKHPWDCDVDATRAGLERFIRALFIVRGHFTDSFALGPIDTPSRNTIFVRVWIPHSRYAEFVRLARCAPLRKPARVIVGTTLSLCREIEGPHNFGVDDRGEATKCVDCGALPGVD